MPLLIRRSHAQDELPGGSLGRYPVLDAPSARPDRGVQAAGIRRPALFPVCANPGCTAGWLRLWRSRSAPVFEGGWCCSPECTRAQVGAALGRELGGRTGAPEPHRHRIPLGLEMLEQGWISAAELRAALAAQREAGGGRIGRWLRSQGVSERLITRALGVQWSCPVFAADSCTPESLTGLVPRLFLDAFGALPMRVGAERILYLGFEDRLDPSLALAIERITGLRVECGLVEESSFRRAQELALEARYPPVELVEAVSEAALAGAMTRAIERARPVESRLARVHDCVWLRMALRPQRVAVPSRDAIADLIGSLNGSGRGH